MGSLDCFISVFPHVVYVYAFSQQSHFGKGYRHKIIDGRFLVLLQGF